MNDAYIRTYICDKCGVAGISSNLQYSYKMYPLPVGWSVDYVIGKMSPTYLCGRCTIERNDEAEKKELKPMTEFIDDTYWKKKMVSLEAKVKTLSNQVEELQKENDILNEDFDFLVDEFEVKIDSDEFLTTVTFKQLNMDTGYARGVNFEVTPKKLEIEKSKSSVLRSGKINLSTTGRGYN